MSRLRPCRYGVTLYGTCSQCPRVIAPYYSSNRKTRCCKVARLWTCCGNREGDAVVCMGEIVIGISSDVSPGQAVNTLVHG